MATGRFKKFASNREPVLRCHFASRTKRLLLVCAWFILFSASLAASSAIAQEPAKRLVAVLDYLGSDYKNAVQSGKIVNAAEYEEMQEFAKRSLELLSQLKDTDKTDKAGVEPSLKRLAGEIAAKADPATVGALAGQIKDKVISVYNIVPYPKVLPSLSEGKKIYFENCAQCHGESGKGDGLGRENAQSPPPANFTDPELMAGLSPFKAFNATSFGIDKTAMPSFSALPEEQRWQVAFYVLSIRFSAEKSAAGAALLKNTPLSADLTSVASLATHSDDQLSEKIKTQFEAGEAGDILAYLRRGILEQKPADPLLIARTLLREASDLYAAGEKDKAYQKAADAYLEGFELAEPSLFAKDAAFGRGIEAQFTQFRNAIRSGVSPAEIENRYQELELKLDDASRLLAREDRFESYYTFLNSALIILREGLEAALIIAAILAMLRVIGATASIRYVHLGWILALVAGGLTWLATQTVLTLTGKHRESIEGFITIFAALVLFYVGYWLHTHAEAKKWRAFIEKNVKDVLSTKRIFALLGISFFAVYREAFEVVLFYQALWLQNELTHSEVIWGLIAGSVALVILTISTLRLGVQIPLKYFFGATGAFLYIMAIIFAGTGIHQLQAAGWIPSTSLNFPPQLPLLGIYPTVESLLAQGILVLGLIAAILWLGKDSPTTVSVRRT